MNKEMHNRKKIQEAFGEIHASEQLKNRVLETCRLVGQEGIADKSKCKFRFRKLAIAAAAVVCLFLGTTAISAANGFSFIDLFYSNSTPKESHYTIPVTIELVPTDYFTGEIEEVKNIVLKQIREYEPWMSTMPESFGKRFDSVEDALAYMGISDIEHPLEGENADVVLCAHCNQEGEIAFVSLQTEYDDVNGNRVQLWYNIYTDLTEGDAIAEEIGESVGNREFLGLGEYSRSSLSGSALHQNKKNYVTINMSCTAAEYVEFSIEAKNTGSGMEVPVITTSGFDSGGNTMECYFAKGAVLYHINVISDNKHTGSLKATMDKILKLY